MLSSSPTMTLTSCETPALAVNETAPNLTLFAQAEGARDLAQTPCCRTRVRLA